MIRFEYLELSMKDSFWWIEGVIPVFVAGGSRCRENASRMQNRTPQVPKCHVAQWIPMIQDDSE